MPLRQTQYKHAAAMIKSIVTGIKELTRHIMSIMHAEIRQHEERGVNAVYDNLNKLAVQVLPCGGNYVGWMPKL